MNLVSNKVIQRFKQGKSIQKFQTAGKLSGKNTIVDSDGKTYKRYPQSPWFSWFKPDKWYDDDGKEITKEITLKNGYILKPNGTYSHVTARRAAQQSTNKKPAVQAVNKNAPQQVIDNSVKKLGISSGQKSYLEQQGININPETLDPYLQSQLISVLSENPKQQIVVQETPQTNVPIEQERDLNKISDYSKNLVSSTLKSMNTPQQPINGYTKYLIDRFGMKFKKGGSIKKFQNPSSPLFIDWSKQTPAGQELVDRAISQTRAITQPVEERVQKASKRNKSVAAKQLEMWNMGAFKGVIDRKTGKEVTFERAVDGIRGRMTREAEANRDKIWEARRQNFKEQNSTAQTSPQYDEMSNPNNAWGFGFIKQSNPLNQSNPIFRISHDNMYPYQYENPGVKFLKALFVKDPRRKAMDEFLELDFSKPKDVERGKELKSQFSNLDQSRSLESIQQIFKARRDEMYGYDGLPQKYSSYKVHEWYKSPTAGNNPTYVLANENLRKSDQIAAATYLANNYGLEENGGKGILSGDKKHVIYNVTGDPSVTRADYSIVTNLDGSNPIIVDEWNYKWDKLYNPTHQKFVTADTIPHDYMKYKNRSQNYVKQTINDDDNFTFIDMIKGIKTKNNKL